jgi:hypothetical protein
VDKRLYAFMIAYSIFLAILYAIPSGLENEWYSFFAYLDAHGAVPYVDVREGYPPLGFLVYMPLYHASRGNRIVFAYGFRALNGLFLVAAVAMLYLILKEISGRRGVLRLTLCYAFLPSVIIANIYSNDVVALLPASLAIYSMLKGRSLSCGILIGIAALGKGFPLLLIIPALIALKLGRDRLRLLASTFGVLALGSLPFLMLNPFTYISTFTHHSSRGPWETVWALLDGYHSHGGLLHPYFDKYFYHGGLVDFYNPSPYDHAFYEWRFSLLPLLLTLCQMAVVSILAFIRVDERRGLASLCGLVYLGYMLFFKGYSTQFSVSTQFYVLLAALDMPLPFIIPLEISHILQMVSWMGLPWIPFEPVRNLHLPLLAFSILLRTVIFVILLSRALARSGLELSRARELLGGVASILERLKDRRLAISAFASLLAMILALSQVYGFTRGGGMLRIYEGSMKLTPDKWGEIKLDGLMEGDQVLVRLDTGTWLIAEVLSASGARPVERGLRNPYNLRDSFNETLLFFRAGEGVNTLRVRMGHPRIPFRITDGLDGDLQVNMTSNGSGIVLRVRDLGADGSSSLFRMAYPLRLQVDESFCLSLGYKVLGSSYRVLLDIFDESDDWLYTYEASENFDLDGKARDLSGYANLMGDEISLMAISLVVGNGGFADLILSELTIDGSRIRLGIDDEEEVVYRVLVERDFKPTPIYSVSLAASFILSLLTIHLSLRRGERMELDFPSMSL